ncbi:hypothetical protein CVU83_00410 [Candidatus Falkowbacteria bacterium HGW-Falkowbacteria-2]|uniref:Major facilitator superfamily (MFS) profile domain-containing protein n=1 Tax=Candidatus Falkowbacteria bacterium HGW-Falkowbacteria-2 TaxID=2013769 RepID=A0A2N2E3J2_9BACT|nr:MAG: hypothetical protein CVU83_00410 [Candidatus Falkowbacteria bacterium HGW-Falkowbacteria-2]
MKISLFHRHNNKRNLILLYILGTILAIANALPAYVQSNYLGTMFSITWISIFFATANLVTVFAIIYFPRLIKRIGNIATTEIVLFLFILSLLGMSLATSFATIFPAFILLSVVSSLIWINMDLLVEKFSEDATTGRTRTIYFTAINLGWILAPTLSSYLVQRGDYYWVFIAAAAFLVPFFVLLMSYRKRFTDAHKYKVVSTFKTIKGLWKNKNLRGIYFISLLLSIFFSSAVVYIPIYLHQNLGFSWAVLGVMFSFMLLPFLLIEIPSGYLADKYFGEKEMLGIGLGIIIIALFLFFAVKTPDIWIWGSLLFFSRVGAALVEAMRESYFFKLVAADDVPFINFFRTTSPLGYLIGTGLAAVVLLFYPLEYLFIFIALLMSSGFLFLYIIKDTR